uniref:Uncharacterized protein n=1 Tax=Arundo donax TaxID=35708 RepID=A0A0A8YQC0_ARUDO
MFEKDIIGANKHLSSCLCSYISSSL